MAVDVMALPLLMHKSRTSDFNALISHMKHGVKIGIVHQGFVAWHFLDLEKRSYRGGGETVIVVVQKHIFYYYEGNRRMKERVFFFVCNFIIQIQFAMVR